MKLLAALCFSLMLCGCTKLSAKFEPVIRDIQSGKFVLPTNGMVQLPQRFASLTPKGEIFVERQPTGRLLVLFPTWYGRGSDLEGMLYCSSPLQPTDYYTINSGSGQANDYLSVGGRDLLTVQKHHPPWYEVTRRMD